MGEHPIGAAANDEGDNSMRRGLEHLARLRAEGLSFSAAVALGLGLGHTKTPSRGAIRYNGAGLAGDRKAVEADFAAAFQRVAPPVATRVR
jgi:hypothetical protein